MALKRLLLDTSAYSWLFRGHAELRDILNTADEVWLTPIVLGELRAGFLQGSRSAENEKKLQEFLAVDRVRVALLDEESSRRYASLVLYLKQQGTPIPTNDVWIAATAVQHGFELVTADSDFKRIPTLALTLLSPTPES
jgi:tRNA(fMet)-specific endonuclease VapC